MRALKDPVLKAADVPPRCDCFALTVVLSLNPFLFLVTIPGMMFVLLSLCAWTCIGAIIMRGHDDNGRFRTHKVSYLCYGVERSVLKGRAFSDIAKIKDPMFNNV